MPAGNPSDPPGLVCYGNLTVDDVVLPDRSERPGCIGGDALYATLAARVFEPGAQPVAPLGRNAAPAVLRTITELGLSPIGMPMRDAPTLHNRVVYDDDGGRVWTLYNDEADFATLSPFADDVPALYTAAPRHLLLAMALPATRSLVERLGGDDRRLLAFDPQEDYIAGNQQTLYDIIGAVDIFMPSEEEVSRLLGHRDWPRAARELAREGPALVLVKRGADGVLLYDKTRDLEFRVPAHPASTENAGAVVDATGAGDSFCGAFIACIDKMAPERALLAGSAAASVTVSGYGAAPLFGTPPAVIRGRFDERAAAGRWRGAGSGDDPRRWIDE